MKMKKQSVIFLLLVFTMMLGCFFKTSTLQVSAASNGTYQKSFNGGGYYRIVKIKSISKKYVVFTMSYESLHHIADSNTIKGIRKGNKVTFKFKEIGAYDEKSKGTGTLILHNNYVILKTKYAGYRLGTEGKSIKLKKKTNAAAKVKLNKSKLSLQVGKSYTLKLKNAKAKKVTWSSSNKNVATISKKGKVTAKTEGFAKITAKYNGKKYSCKVTVWEKETASDTEQSNNSDNSTSSATDVSNRKLIYDAAETADELPYVSNYAEFKYSSFTMYLFPVLFYGGDSDAYQTEDYRGRELHYELTIKNSGQRDLPMLDICFFYTVPDAYPVAFRVYDPSTEYGDYAPEGTVATELAQPIKKGETYTYSFDYTIPEDAENQECDEDGNQFPIVMYISNEKDISPYTDGDEITILGFKIYE